MPVTARLLDGTEKDSETILAALRSEVFPQALRCLNEETLEAKRHLAILAKGAPGSRLTYAAKAALERLALPVNAH